MAKGDIIEASEIKVGMVIFGRGRKRYAVLSAHRQSIEDGVRVHVHVLGQVYPMTGGVTLATHTGYVDDSDIIEEPPA